MRKDIIACSDGGKSIYLNSLSEFRLEKNTAIVANYNPLNKARLSKRGGFCWKIFVRVLIYDKGSILVNI